MKQDDKDLASRAAAGSRDALTTLVERHYEFMRRVAWRVTGDEDAANDVAQIICEKIGRAIRGYRADSSFRTWLYRIVFNAAIDHIRANQRNDPTAPSDMEKLLDKLGAHRSPDDGLSLREIWEAVDRLPPQQRQAMLLVYGEGLSHAEAGEIMGCSESNVSGLVHEARKRLRIVLKDTG